MPRRLLNALTPQPGRASQGIEPVLTLDPLVPTERAVPEPLGRRAIERALDEGSRRVYLPMQEAEVVEQRRK